MSLPFVYIRPNEQSAWEAEFAAPFSRVVNGVKFDNSSASLICLIDVKWRDNVRLDDPEFIDKEFAALYRTQVGGFVRVIRRPDAEPWEGDWCAVEMLSDDDARAWAEKFLNTEDLEAAFGPMPEHGSPEMKFALRLPRILHTRIKEMAEGADMSMNALIISILHKSARQYAAKKVLQDGDNE